jgi:hypothetical protein
LIHILVNISGIRYFQEDTLNTIHVQLVVGMDFVESWNEGMEWKDGVIHLVEVGGGFVGGDSWWGVIHSTKSTTIHGYSMGTWWITLYNIVPYQFDVRSHLGRQILIVLDCVTLCTV